MNINSTILLPFHWPPLKPRITVMPVPMIKFKPRLGKFQGLAVQDHDCTISLAAAPTLRVHPGQPPPGINPATDPTP
eukprot:5948-Rhodomonas_salina.1